VYNGSTAQTGIQTVGVFDDTQDTLLAVARLSDPVDSPSIDFTISLADDTDTPKTVWTNTGLNTLRDILASTAVSWPQTYAYGSDSTDPSVSDTSLGNQQVTQDLDNIFIGEVETQSEWENNTPTFADDVPLAIENGKLKQLQTTQFTETEDLLNFAGNVISGDSSLSGGGGIELTISNDFVQFDFSPTYRVPAGQWNADAHYNSDSFTGTVTAFIDGQQIFDSSFSSRTVDNNLLSSPDIQIELLPSETYSFRVELTSVSGGSITIDTMQAIDFGDRFGGFGITRSGTFVSSDAAFTAPELYPDLQEVLLDTFVTTREIDQATVQSSWNDTTNKQYIELSNDGSTFIRTNNNDTASATFNNLKTNLDVRLGISRYAADPLLTPTNGDATQEVDLVEAFANPDAITVEQIGEADVRAIIRDSAATGVTFAEAGLLDTNSDLLTRSLVPEFTKTSDQKVISGERLRFQNP
jgi:hypothetical protein